jgi:predicted glycosyltransferase
MTQMLSKLFVSAACKSRDLRKTVVNLPSCRPSTIDFDAALGSEERAQNCDAIPAYPLISEALGMKRKRIWIDIDNSPHVPFFLPIIEELQKHGVQLILTARNMYQVCELLTFYQLPCKVVGGHCGKNTLLKVAYNCVRAAQLSPMAVRCRPDVALSHGSRAQVLVCKALGIPTIVMHDYEHSTKTGFIEPDWILMPDVIPDRAMSKRIERILKYPGLKEDVYVPRFRPDRSILSHLGISADDVVVTLRPPATDSHYHHPESDFLFAETLRFLAGQSHIRVVGLPRNAKQEQRLRRDWADLIADGRLVIPQSALNGLNLIWFSDLVISGGGTMNREAATLGVPVYSIFRGKIGAVDQYLARQGRLTLIENARDVRTKIKLAHWSRPNDPETRNCAALQSIIRTVLAIADVARP